jgi:glucokinase
MNDAVLIDAGMEDCRVSIMQRSGDERPRYAHNFEISNAQFDGVAGVLEHYRVLAGLDRLPPMIAVAFSGPVRGRRDTFSNGVWTFSEADLKKQFGFEQVLVVNDVAAAASALPWLGAKDLTPICGRAASETHRIGEGRYGLIYTNHGLGVGALTYTNNGYEIIDTEGGHAAFAPVTPLHTEILRSLSKVFGRVSYERIVSNPGLVNLHRAICDINRWPHAAMTSLEILLYGRTNADPACRETLNAFFDILGAFAGDVALNVCTESGVYLLSDVILETGDDVQKSTFRQRFEEKGHFTNFVSVIPTFLVSNRSARLVGLARVASDAIRVRESGKMSASAVSRAFSEAMDATNQTVIIVGPGLKIVSVSGAPWGDATIQDAILAPGADLAEAFAELDAKGLLGLDQDGDGLEGLIARLKRGENFAIERRLFGGRVSQLRAMPREKGGYVIVETDITELRHRTVDLENLARDLRATSSLAEAASHAKSQFLANMSHEIRTPLNGVLGMADILSRTALAPEQKDMVDTIVSSGNGLLTVINDVLDFSKIEAGKMRLAADPFNLRKLIEDVAAALAPQADAKGLELVVRLEPHMCEQVLGDEGRVRQILINVVGNAIKFTDHGHVLVDVAAAASGDDAHVTLVVRDTGCGIPKDKLERVFEMFEQVDGSASRHHDGTGLGLAITRRLLDLMRGTISVDSEVGVGTGFSMSFVLGADKNAASTAAPVSADLTGHEILIVDDKPINRQILEEQSRSWGMVPVSVSGAGQAMELLAGSGSKRFAIAILDYQMPGMNGVELAQSLKDNPQTAGLPLLLLSSVGYMSDLDKDLPSLFAAVLVKPARTMQLLQKVSMIVGAQRPAANEAAHLLEELEASAVPPAAPAPAQPMNVSVAAAVSEPVATASESGVPVEKAAGSKIVVLVAEDNAVNRKVIEAMLSNGGYDIHFAHDGEQAVSAYRTVLPDIVLMDVSMPKLDGLGATVQIRRIEAELGRRAAVIGLTAHAMPEDRQVCIDAGMDEYLAKPIKRDALSQVMGAFGR